MGFKAVYAAQAADQTASMTRSGWRELTADCEQEAGDRSFCVFGLKAVEELWPTVDLDDLTRLLDEQPAPVAGNPVAVSYLVRIELVKRLVLQELTNRWWLYEARRVSPDVFWLGFFDPESAWPTDAGGVSMAAAIQDDKVPVQPRAPKGQLAAVHILAGAEQSGEKLSADTLTRVEELCQSDPEFSAESEVAVEATDALLEIRAWAIESGAADGLIESVAATQGLACLPGRVQEAIACLDRLPAPSETRRARYSLRAAFEELESDEGFELYRARELYDDARPTLQDLGEKHGITRERVRQRAKAVEKRIAAGLERGADWPVSVAAETLRVELSPLATVAELEDQLGQLGGGSGRLTSDQHRRRLLLKLSGLCEREDGWVTEGLIEERSKEALAELIGDGLAVSFEDACAHLDELGVSPSLRERWVSELEGFRRLDDKLVLWGGGLVGKAAAVLAAAGEPLSAREIYDRIGEDKHFRGFKARLGDDRFVRRGKDLYGLAEWGGDAYSSVADAIETEIERHGGSANLGELMETLSERFGVAPGSVHAYAKGPRFEIDDETVTLCRGTAKLPDSPPMELSRCFRLSKGWAERVEVTPDVLRGSGIQVSTSFARLVGITPDEPVECESPWGPLSVYWTGLNSAIGSLREVAEDLGATIGDALFVELSADRALSIHLRSGPLDDLDGLERLCAECGLPAERAPSLRAVAEAVGLEPDAPAATLRAHLTKRGQRQLADFVPHETADPDAILDSLTSLGD